MKRFIFGMITLMILTGICLSSGCEKNEVKIQHEETYAPKVVEQKEVVVP